MYLSSNDLQNTFTHKSLLQFTTVLPREINLDDKENLEKGIWKVALTELSLDKFNQLDSSLVISCDIVGESYIKGCFAPVLRSLEYIQEEESLHSEVVFSAEIPYYIPVTTKRFNSISISIASYNNFPSLCEFLNLDKRSIKCSLHFLRDTN